MPKPTVNFQGPEIVITPRSKVSSKGSLVHEPWVGEDSKQTVDGALRQAKREKVVPPISKLLRDVPRTYTLFDVPGAKADIKAVVKKGKKKISDVYTQAERLLFGDKVTQEMADK